MPSLAGYSCFTPAAQSLHQHLFPGVKESFHGVTLMSFLQGNQPLNPLRSNLRRDLAIHLGCPGAGTGGINEGKGRIVLHLLHQRQGVLKLGFRLSRERHNNVRGNANARHGSTQLIQTIQVVGTVVMPVHLLQDFIIAGLYRQVKLRQHMLAGTHGFNQLIRQILGVGRHETDPLNAYIIQSVQELGEGCPFCQSLAVGINILPQKHDLFHAPCLQCFRLTQDGIHVPAPLPSPHIRHHAVGAEIIAPVHDGDIGRILTETLHRHIFRHHVLLIHFHHRMILRQCLVEHLRHTVQVGRAKGQVNKAVLLQDFFRHARLLHHAAAYGYLQPGIFLLHLPQPVHIAQCPAFCIIPNAAGIENDEIRFLPVSGFLHAHFLQHTSQVFAVVGVHLAAIRHHMKGAGTIRQMAHLLHIQPLLFHLLPTDCLHLAVSHVFPP